jgi:hypothetical protein
VVQKRERERETAFQAWLDWLNCACARAAQKELENRDGSGSSTDASEIKELNG